MTLFSLHLQTRTCFVLAVALMAVAVAAAAFYLVSLDGASAEPASSTHVDDCSQLQPLTLTAGPEWSGPVRQMSPEGSCGFEVNVRSEPRHADSAPCLVTFTPDYRGGSGLGVDSSHTGDCSNLATESTIFPPNGLGSADSWSDILPPPDDATRIVVPPPPSE